MLTEKEKELIAVFKNGLKTNQRTVSVKTLLSERNLKRIDYKPYYQRNYVWDVAKQSFFIESVLLGTEIPPLILFKSGLKTEVIDGRQRFETLKRFREDDFTLNSKGLIALPALEKKSFNKLDEELKEIFLSSNIRVYEFETVSNIASELEDRVKKEIFRRYNTGITPLTMVEVDAAKYDNDAFSKELQNRIEEDRELYNGICECFFPNVNQRNDASLKGKVVDYLRRMFILPKFPISKYASSTERSEYFELLYDSVTETSQDVDDYFAIHQDIITLKRNLERADAYFGKNKWMYECILWATSILKQENVAYDFERCLDKIKTHYMENKDIYSDDNVYYYERIMKRFTDTATLFRRMFDVNFDLYLRNSNFSSRIKSLKQGENEARNVVAQLDNLRINKPNSISKPVEEILSDVSTNRYMIRPSYQRQERVTEQKAASIIESILLGIALPPIFVYKKKDGTKEVIDGQQRLLSIIAFIGKQYRNENEELVFSKNSNFKLKKLKILTELNGKKFSDLSETDQDKIYDFDIDEIIIEEKFNDEFDPTDLFIRLNQKPYPIQQNSFEMWNSTVDSNVVNKVKEVTDKYSSWFYSKECSDREHRTDRMENEELVTLLSYIDYMMDKNSFGKALGTFKRIDRITCRIKDKNAITEYLMRLENDVNERQMFLSYIEQTNGRISYFSELFGGDVDRNTLNVFFNVKEAQSFRRSYQDFYIVWIVLHAYGCLNKTKERIKSTILYMLGMLRNKNNENVDAAYYERFESALKKVMNGEDVL